MAGALTAALPPLRDDLVLAPGAPEPGGSPTWTIYDPAMHRYVRIGWAEFEMLSRWALRDPAAIADAVTAETTLVLSPGEVESMAAFAVRAGLIQPTGAAETALLAARRRASRHGPGAWLLHNYLFLRLRLVDPDRFLAGLLPWVGWLFGRGPALALAAAAALGLFLIGRQWDTFRSGLADLLSLQGLVEIALALSASKILHELGHGLAAKKLGCRVPAMGVAFLVLAPVLWTDVTDAWKLRRRRDRLLIDAAGVLAEVALATAASLAWALLPDGPARSAALVLSGSTWLLTLAVNLNPLMRFDGYYLLSDLLDVPNLQERGFAAARWRLRRLLFGLADPAPERFRTGTGAAVLAWAYSTWVYRFTLFLGIALLVYHMAFKALGFFLGGVEIWFFLARPILRELLQWRVLMARSGLNRRSLAALAVLAGLAGLAIMPWQGRVAAPAVLRAARQVALAVDEPGRLLQVATTGQAVRAGDAAFTLQSAEVDHTLATATAKLAGIDAALRGQTFDADRATDINISLEEARRARAQLADATVKSARLAIRAPFDGVVLDVPPGLRAGLDTRRRETLGMLVEPGRTLVEAYVGEADLSRIAVGAPARFMPEDGGPALDAAVVSIAPSATGVFDVPELASTTGGPVPAHREPDGATVTTAAEYRVLLQPAHGDTGEPRPVRLRGLVSIEGERASLAGRAWRNAVAVVVRETGL